MEFWDDFFFDLGYFFTFYHIEWFLKPFEYISTVSFAKYDFFARFLFGVPFGVIFFLFGVFLCAFH